MNKRHVPELRPEDGTPGTSRTKEGKHSKIEETLEHPDISSCFPAGRERSARGEFREDIRIFEEGMMDEIGVFRKVKIGANEDAGEIESIAEEVEKAGKGGDAFLALPGVEIGIRATGIKDVPGKGSQFHGEHHLGSCHFHGLIAVVVECADDVTDTGVSVEKNRRRK